MSNDKLTLNEQFLKLGHLVMKTRLRQIDDSPEPDFWRKRLLGLIKTHPGLTMSELTELLGRRIPAGEELLFGLEKKGYIEVTAKDGAVEKIVALTELGQKEAAGFPAFDEAFSVLSEDEQATMRAYLSRVIDELERKAADESADDNCPTDGWFSGPMHMGGLAAWARMRGMHAMFRSGKEPDRRCPDGFCPGGTFGGFLWDYRSGI